MMNYLLYVLLYISVQKRARKCKKTEQKSYRTEQNSFGLHKEFSHLREKR